ncbi:MAG: CBS domain-containing protein [Nitrososphaerales archaeon]|jgi:predicted transcriptional regulator
MRKYAWAFYSYMSESFASDLPDRQTLVNKLASLKARKRISDSKIERLIAKASGGRYTLDQTTISRIFNQTQSPKYEDLWWIQLVLLQQASDLSYSRSLRDLCTPEEEVERVGPENTIKDAARLMAKNGYSQLPVFDASRNLRGVVTDEAIMRAMMYPPEEQSSEEWIGALGRIKFGYIFDFQERRRPFSSKGLAELVSPFPSHIIDESLHAVAQALLFDPAITLTDKDGKLAGLITRSDFLKLQIED